MKTELMVLVSDWLDGIDDEPRRLITVAEAVDEIDRQYVCDRDTLAARFQSGRAFTSETLGMSYTPAECHVAREWLLVYVPEGGRARLIDIVGELSEAADAVVPNEGNCWLDELVGSDFTIEDPGLHLAKVKAYWPGEPNQYFYEALKISLLAPEIKAVASYIDIASLASTSTYPRSEFRNYAIDGERGTI